MPSAHAPLAFRMTVRNHRAVSEELSLFSETLGFLFYEVPSHTPRVLLTSTLKIPPRATVHLDVEINEPYPGVSSPVLVFQLQGGVLLLYALDIYRDNPHFRFSGHPVVSSYRHSQGEGSLSFSSLPCTTRLSCNF